MPFSLTSPYTWLLGALAAVILFGAGFYLGDTHSAKITAAAQAVAVQNATAAQAKADTAKAAEDRALAVEDAASRAKDEQVAIDAAAKAETAVPSLLAAVKPKPVKAVNGVCPAPPEAVVPAAVMHSLNDPSIIGAQ